MNIFVSFLVLSFLVFFHELGHFIAARFFGVYVERFSIGFGKKIFKKKIGNTEYCIGLIPLGGYVQMKGQDDSDPTKQSSDIDSYNTKKPWQRIIIAFSGPFANFLLAFILFFAVGLIGVEMISNKVGDVSQNSPAYFAGIKKGDEIISVNGNKVSSWENISSYIKKDFNSTNIEIKRNSEILNLNLIPIAHKTQTIFKEEIVVPIIGIKASSETFTKKFTISESFAFALEQTKKASKLIMLSLQKLIQGIVSPKDLSGPITIVKVTSDAAEAGIVALLIFTAFISVNLGIFNLLPIPALDGGHILINLYEWIFRKAPSLNVLSKLMFIAWFILLSLMVFVTINDIMRLIGNE